MTRSRPLWRRKHAFGLLGALTIVVAFILGAILKWPGVELFGGGAVVLLFAYVLMLLGLLGSKKLADDDAKPADAHDPPTL